VVGLPKEQEAVRSAAVFGRRGWTLGRRRGWTLGEHWTADRLRKQVEALERLHDAPAGPPVSKLAYAWPIIRSNPKNWFLTHRGLEDRIAAFENEYAQFYLASWDE
jgi:hypothetical protein